MLVRQYIHQRLHQYYSQAAHSVVGGVADDAPIAFGRIWGGAWGWRRMLYDQWYNFNNGQWLTPTELFQPYYSQCIAEWIVGRIQAKEEEMLQHDPVPPAVVDIIEVGGGRGTNAVCILNHLEKQYPTIFKERLGTYELVDSSATLLELQKERTTMHKRHMRFRQCDMNDVAEGKETLVASVSSAEEQRRRHRIVLFCEVFDNLPHDLLSYRRGQYLQTELLVDNNNTKPASSYQEIERPLTDPLLQQCLAVTHRHSSAVKNKDAGGWYPTVAIALLQHLAAAQCDVWAADFDDLCTPRGAPLVTDMDGNDHPQYLLPPPPVVTPDNDTAATTTTTTCTDILFPTDFSLLAHSVAGCYPAYTTRVERQAEFVQRYPHLVDQTRLAAWWPSSYNPMVDDFVNCSVLTMEHHADDGAV